MRILQENTAVVIVDIQEKLFPFIQEKDALLANCIKLVDGLHILEIPVIITQQYSKGLGQTLPVISEKFKEFSFIEKNCFSCCDEPEFMNQLSKKNKKNILLLGIEAHVCVLQTCLDLTSFGYVPVIVEDCIGSRKKNDKETALNRMRKEGALVTSYESILLELTRFAGTEKFKRISSIIK